MAEAYYYKDYDVKESLVAARFIAKRAQHVWINREGIENIVHYVIQFWMDNIGNYKVHNKFRIPPTYPNRGDVVAIDWLFVLHTLNFSLWNQYGTKQWTVHGAKGYNGLCNAIKRAIDEGKPIFNPAFYTTITQNELEIIFRSDDGETGIPLIQERVRILHQIGNVLLNKYQGTFVNCIISADLDADKLINLLFNEFESYRDEAIFEGSKVRFHNKAKSLIIDIWLFSKDLFNFNLNSERILSTMFINYRAPQVLFCFEAIYYSDVMMTRFQNNNEPLLHGSREELEIRGCSLVVAKKVCEKIEKKIRQITSYLKPVLNEESFNVPILVNNCILGILANFHDTYLECEDPNHYIRTLYY